MCWACPAATEADTREPIEIRKACYAGLIDKQKSDSMDRFVFLLLLALAGCGTGHGSPPPAAGIAAAVECAPFARALSGVQLYGSAADWWQEADGRYNRTHNPEIGSVLVFRRFSQLPSGHVAVVSQVVSARQILVAQANWLHHRVTEDQPVLDVSSAGDWSEVRVWWPPSGQMGVNVYRTYGFIRPARSINRSALLANTPAAVKLAESGW